jgi:NADH-quinone oxidoreductase subunit C
MEGSAQEQILNLMKEKYGDDILHIEAPYQFLTLTLKKDRLVEIVRFLYDHPETKFQYLTMLGGIHFRS